MIDIEETQTLLNFLREQKIGQVEVVILDKNDNYVDTYDNFLTNDLQEAIAFYGDFFIDRVDLKYFDIDGVKVGYTVIYVKDDVAIFDL